MLFLTVTHILSVLIPAKVPLKQGGSLGGHIGRQTNTAPTSNLFPLPFKFCKLKIHPVEIHTFFNNSHISQIGFYARMR